MKPGVIVSIVVAVLAAVGLTQVFVSQASPYVTVKEAEGKGQVVHVVGKIVPDTIKQNSLAREVQFVLTDETGTMPVRYVGPPQSNLEQATQVVVIGNKKAGTFECDKMLVKCPSKYESEGGNKV